jgi:hypothetical protein
LSRRRRSPTVGAGLSRLLGIGIGLAAAVVGARPAAGAEVTRVVSAFDDDNPFDVNLTLSWLREAKSAFVKREGVAGAGATAGTDLFKDLQFHQTTNIINLRADVGIFRDLGFHIDAPIVLSDDRSLSFDQSAGQDCSTPGQGGTLNCVNQNNSTTLRDGILPVQARDPNGQPTQWGINSQNGGSFSGNSSQAFVGPTRRGLEYLGLGLTWAVFNQRRDDTKPTWTLGFDARLDVGKDMGFDPTNPGANTAVGLGYHQLVWSTNVSKRFRYFEPYFGLWYMLPVRDKNSPFVKYPTGGQTTVDPQQEAGVQFGVEQIAWENHPAHQRVTVEVRGRMTEHFFGRSHSELWEVLSGAPGCATDVTQCRKDPTAGGANVGIDFDEGRASPYPGVTETEAYASFGGDAGLNIQVGEHVRFRGLFGFTADQPHFITFANAGVAPAGKPVDLTNPAEKNPAYREVIDDPGRRFKVEGTEIWSLFLEGSLMF